jgi:tRNA-2-methylthio-N6-dimethylallyladenosine synthase
MKYSIVTYGCQMNEADSDLMSGLLQRAGWEQTSSRSEADLIIINTCSVRRKPEQKVDSLLGELRRWKLEKPDRLIAVAGCMAQRMGEGIARRAQHVDLIVGTRCFHQIEELVARARAREAPVVQLGMGGDPSIARDREDMQKGPARLRAFVPIIRGCSNLCTYCIVPVVRGSEASRPLAGVEREVRSLVERGTREVTLLGQNVLAYGRDLPEETAFPHLLQRLAGISGLWRVRFTTCHPRDVSADLISAMADLPSVCEHIHLPVQAGTDRLLREMHRGYTTDRYLQTVDALRSRVPGVAITTDIMVGFPGETDEEFRKSLRFYERVGFDAAFTFAYSPRPGTAAAERTDQIPRTIRLARLQELIALQNAISVARNEAAVGEEAEVLVDGPAARGEGLLAGRARTNNQVIFAGTPDLQGRLIRVLLTEAHLWGFTGDSLAT